MSWRIAFSSVLLIVLLGCVAYVVITSMPPRHVRARRSYGDAVYVSAPTWGPMDSWGWGPNSGKKYLDASGNAL